MNNLWLYKEYGIYECDEFCLTKLFDSEEKAKKYLKEKVEKEKFRIDSWNRKIATSLENASDDDFLIYKDNENEFFGYLYGYCTEYSINMIVEKVSVE